MSVAKELATQRTGQKMVLLTTGRSKTLNSSQMAMAGHGVQARLNVTGASKWQKRDDEEGGRMRDVGGGANDSAAWNEKENVDPVSFLEL